MHNFNLTVNLSKTCPKPVQIEIDTEGYIAPYRGAYNTPFGQVRGQVRSILSHYIFPGIRRDESSPAKLAKVLSIVSESYGFEDSEAITTRTRRRPIPEARQVCMYFMRKHYRMTLAETGGFFGVDHSTAIHGINAIQDRINAYPAFRQKIENLKNQLYA